MRFGCFVPFVVCSLDERSEGSISFCKEQPIFFGQILNERELCVVIFCFLTSLLLGVNNTANNRGHSPQLLHNNHGRLFDRPAGAGGPDASLPSRYP